LPSTNSDLKVDVEAVTFIQDDKNVGSTVALTNDLVISEEFNETETSDDDNCDIISDHNHLDESYRQRF
jgi:hypothetical protein